MFSRHPILDLDVLAMSMFMLISCDKLDPGVVCFYVILLRKGIFISILILANLLFP